MIAREFSNDPDNIVERSRSEQRTDALAAVNYTLFDFGAGGRRLAAAGARLRAAAAGQLDPISLRENIGPGRCATTSCSRATGSTTRRWCARRRFRARTSSWDSVGGSVAPGAPLVEIVPSEESLLIEAQVRPQDIAAVRLDQRARVEVTAYDPAIYGGLPGSVVAISPDATIEERTGEPFYTVQVRTAANALIDKRGRRLPIGPGMVANVSLIGDKRTVLQYVLSPLTRLQETAFRE